MNRLALVGGILGIALAISVFVFADGLRRWYSGGFFAVMGIVLLVGAFRRSGAAAGAGRNG